MNEDDTEQEMVGPGVADLIVHALDQKPLDFQQTFNDLLQSRIADAVQERKMQIAGGLAVDEPEFEDDSEESEETLEPEDEIEISNEEPQETE